MFALRTNKKNIFNNIFMISTSDINRSLFKQDLHQSVAFIYQNTG